MLVLLLALLFCESDAGKKDKASKEKKRSSEKKVCIITVGPYVSITPCEHVLRTRQGHDVIIIILSIGALQAARDSSSSHFGSFRKTPEGKALSKSVLDRYYSKLFAIARGHVTLYAMHSSTHGSFVFTLVVAQWLHVGSTVPYTNSVGVARDATTLFNEAAAACAESEFEKCYAMFSVFSERFPTLVEV